MLSAATEYNEKKPFEIFTQAEIAQITAYQYDPTIAKLLIQLTQVINNGMHNQSIGWYNKVCSFDLEEKERAPLEIQLGAKKYLETANKLQKPKTGRVEHFTLPSSKKTIEKHVNLYEAFWEDCIEEFINNTLEDITKKSPKDIADGRNKSYIYLLLHIKYSLTTLPLLTEYKKSFLETAINSVIKKIMVKTHLPVTFSLDKIETNEFLFLHHHFLDRINQLTKLKLAFEENPIYTRYIHIRPMVLIQFKQLLSYIETRIKNHIINTMPLIFPDKDKHKHDFILHLIAEKQREIAMVFLFQEKLQAAFGKEDLIEIITHLVGNAKPNLLPTAQLFSFDKEKNIHLIKYDVDDKDAPKCIAWDEQQHWRRNELKNPLLTSPLPALVHTPQASEEFIKTKILYWVKDLKPRKLTIPANIPTSYLIEKAIDSTHSSSLTTLFKLDNKAANTQANNVLYDFFVNEADKREQILKTQHYASLVQLLLKQVDYREKLLFYKVGHQAKTCLSNLERLIQAIHTICLLYPKEIELVREKLKVTKNVQHHNILNYYIDTLNKAGNSYLIQFKKIITYWIGQLREKYNLPTESYTHIYDLIGGAICLLQDDALLEQWQSIPIPCQQPSNVPALG